ncbi:hypothetical protein Q5H92_16575 [Hymenobacter sp. M29]|uniref:Uncharacterized protein n=1 Tax=Hymenobacter mellowenesis TaxID=3063995 RepID=A0ABT9AF18_9BACT|nr:hypothetical protein [Hymenobacter sp. M29]MDO7847982.1 hypothetical protein [Hymenobacter sp. M29]
MPHALTPRQIDAGDFNDYTQSWRQLIDGSDTDALRACFESNDALLNYVFLPQTLVTGLLAGNGTAEIRTKFALAPRNTDQTPVFTMVFYGIDRNQIPTTAYYLAGVAAWPATLGQPLIEQMDTRISFEQAYTWITRWHNLMPDQMRFDLFKADKGRLRGYTHDLPDFEQAIGLPGNGEEAAPALWLNFALPSYHTAELFGTVLTRNSEPDEDNAGTLRLAEDEFYFDISRPCPPAC